MEKMKNLIRTSEATSEANNQKTPCCNPDDPADLCCKDKEQSNESSKRENAISCCSPNEKGKVGCC